MRLQKVTIRPMKILVVEDEKKSATALEKGLKETGYDVDLADKGDSGLQMALDHDYDLVVLDIMLPGRDGWSVMNEMRKAGKKTPVLFLTARMASKTGLKDLNWARTIIWSSRSRFRNCRRA